MLPRPSHRLTQVFAGLLLALNILLVLQTRHLQERVRDLHLRQGPTVGSYVVELSGTTLTGDPLSVDLTDGGSTLVLVFSPICGFCTENWKYWSSLVDALRAVGESHRVIAVNTMGHLEGARIISYAHQHGIDDLTVLTLDAEITLRYNFRFTPQTLLVRSDGRVEKNSLGVLGADDVAEFLSSML